MPELFKAIILGVVQGITEFLPISSTGHLILFEHLLGISQEDYGLTFDAALHLGTLFAVIWFFRKDIGNIAGSVFVIIQKRRIHTSEEKLVLLLGIGTVPAMIIGLLLEDFIDSLFRSPFLVGTTLIFFSFVLWYVEKKSKLSKSENELSKVDALIIGFAQSVALIPGVSRSGITMAAGMWRHLTREQAARFAFLLSVPIVAGAGGKKMLDVIEDGSLNSAHMTFFAFGIISSMIVGYLTIKYFLRFISKNSLMPFIVYRIILGTLLIASYFIVSTP